MIDGWELLKTEEIPAHKVTRFVFRSLDTIKLDVYDVRRVITIHCNDLTVAWSKLGEKLKEKSRWEV